MDAATPNPITRMMNCNTSVLTTAHGVGYRTHGDHLGSQCTDQENDTIDSRQFTRQRTKCDVKIIPHGNQFQTAEPGCHEESCEDKLQMPPAGDHGEGETKEIDPRNHPDGRASPDHGCGGGGKHDQPGHVPSGQRVSTDDLTCRADRIPIHKRIMRYAPSAPSSKNMSVIFGLLARIDHRFGNEGDFGRPERFSESFAIDPVQVE